MAELASEIAGLFMSPSHHAHHNIVYRTLHVRYRTYKGYALSIPCTAHYKFLHFWCHTWGPMGMRKKPKSGKKAHENHLWCKDFNFTRV